MSDGKTTSHVPGVLAHLLTPTDLSRNRSHMRHIIYRAGAVANAVVAWTRYLSDMPETPPAAERHDGQ